MPVPRTAASGLVSRAASFGTFLFINGLFCWLAEGLILSWSGSTRSSQMLYAFIAMAAFAPFGLLVLALRTYLGGWGIRQCAGPLIRGTILLVSVAGLTTANLPMQIRFSNAKPALDRFIASRRTGPASAGGFHIVEVRDAGEGTSTYLVTGKDEGLLWTNDGTTDGKLVNVGFAQALDSHWFFVEED